MSQHPILTNLTQNSDFEKKKIKGVTNLNSEGL